MTIDVDPTSKASEVDRAISHVHHAAIHWLGKAGSDIDLYGRPDRFQSSDKKGITSDLTPDQIARELQITWPDRPATSNDAYLSTIDRVLEHSVNTSSPGFMDKLYSSPSAGGIAGDLTLSVLNTNSHVYTVSPALTVIEKATGKKLAQTFGLTGELSGGVTCPGGASANSMAMLVARNVRFPLVISEGLAGIPKRLAVFTSEVSHYSVMAAAQNLGLGSKAVRKVKSIGDAMDVDDLRAQMEQAVKDGQVPFFIAATAGTTVRGAYDDLKSISQVAQHFNAWFHVDACWGGGAIFSPTHKWKMDGSGLADSISFNPHKMLGVPLTCSFLLGKDLRTFWAANRLEAGYLFHGDDELAEARAVPNEQADETNRPQQDEDNSNWRTSSMIRNAPHPDKVFDLAQFTTQCGRRPDALKMYMHWQYRGAEGMAADIDTAFTGAKTLMKLVKQSPVLAALEGDRDPPCAQACFYYCGEGGKRKVEKRVTREIVKRLVPLGWMTDYAPGATKEEEYLRVVCNRLSEESVVRSLVRDVERVGREVEKEFFGMDE
jgi:glutamate decarboxylase